MNNVYTSAQAIELLCMDKIDGECEEFLQIIKNGAMNKRNLIGTFLRFSQSGNGSRLVSDYNGKISPSCLTYHR